MTREAYRSALAKASVGIAGLGGLGSNCAMLLARAGVGRLVIVDFDRVSEANLDRQAYFLDQVGMAKTEALRANILRAAPDARVEAHDRRLDPRGTVAVFRGCDAIVEALDMAEEKLMLISSVTDAFPEAFLVAASGIAGCGRLDALKARRSGNFAMVGDMESEVGEDMPPMAPRVCAAAAMEADLVVERLLSRSGVMI